MDFDRDTLASAIVGTGGAWLLGSALYQLRAGRANGAEHRVRTRELPRADEQPRREGHVAQDKRVDAVHTCSSLVCGRPGQPPPANERISTLSP
jgi:hypothetical protein